jgi:hypothetical protein
MPQISHIKYKDIIEAWRFDADYFKPEYLNIDYLISKKETKQLSELSEKITDFWAYSQNNFIVYKNEWTNYFIRNQDISDFFISDENRVFIDKEVYEKLSLKLNLYDILLQRTWSIWESAIVLEKDIPSSANQNLAQVKLKHDIINSFYVLTYLNCYFWKKYFERLATWNVQPRLNLQQINKIQIPIFSNSFQEKIENLVWVAYKSQQKSKQLYQEAEDLLLTELWLKNHEISHTLTFSTTKKAVDEAWRYDADYFQPKYDELIEKIENYKWGWDYVENIFKHKKWYEPWAEAYTQDGKDFIRVSDFTKFWIDWTDKKISEKLYDELKWDYQAKKWEILFTKDWTIWITYVLKEDLKWIISSAFLRLNLKEEYENQEKECLALILNSIICKLQVERFSWWALISHLKPSDFEKIKIPLINSWLQKEISDKIKESFKLRNESKQLLEQAKKMVEDEIEKE